MKFTVGGEEFEIEPEDVNRAMGGVAPELIHIHVVELMGTVYPPKQVFARITGRPRQSFTTQEAQRVLSRLGFVCREARRAQDGGGAWVSVGPTNEGTSPFQPITIVESDLATIKLAIAELDRRVKALESSDKAA